MAGSNREFLKSELVRAKKYFYVLRPLLAMRWTTRQSGSVPMEFEKLVDACVDSDVVRSAIADLLEKKRAGKELDSQPKIPALSDFIDAELERLKNMGNFEEREKPDAEKLNDLFRQAFESVSRPQV